MKIWVNIHTYNTYGGNPSLSLVGRYFQTGLPPVGTAIKEIDVHVYFSSSTGPTGSLESLFDRYEGFIKRLPSSTYFKTKAKLEINFLSGLGGSETVAGYGPPKLSLFVAGAKEIAGQFSLIPRKLKSSDDFQSDVFLGAICRKLESLPRTTDEFEALKVALDAENKKELESMDEWEKLGIDWEDYHPKSRTVLSSPYFWDCGDDFSPNGNDTGADVLAMYAEWRKRARKASGVSFLEKLMRDWGVVVPPPPVDEATITVCEESRIGLAFAQLKIDGFCEEPVRALALESISQCRQRMVEQHRDWPLLGERVRTLAVMEAKLKERSEELIPGR
jgi:uncharacterized protein YfeS